MAGVSGASAVFEAGLRTGLERVLRRVEDGEEVARKVLSDVGFLQQLHGRVHRLVVRAYVESIRTTYGVSLVFAGLALVVGVVSRERKIVG